MSEIYVMKANTIRHNDGSRFKQMKPNKSIISSYSDGAIEKKATKKKLYLAEGDFEVAGKEHVFAFIVFVMLGTISISGWNVLLSLIPSLQHSIYENDNNFMKTLPPTYCTTVLFFVILFSKINIVQTWVIPAALSGLSILSLGPGVLCQCIPENQASLYLHVYVILMGFFAAVSINCAYGVGSRFPRLYVGAAGAGLGFGGVLTFFVFVLAKFVLFEANASGLRKSAWTISILYCIISLTTILFFIILMRRPWVEVFFGVETYDEKKRFKLWRVNDFQRPVMKDVDTEIEPIHSNQQLTYEALGYFGMMKVTLWNSLLRFLTFYQHNVIIPNIGPYKWMTTVFTKTLHIGNVQVSDFLGRLLPNFFPIFLIKESTVGFILFLRCFAVIGSILSMRLPSNVIFGNFWFQSLQMFFLIFTGGWLNTVVSIHLRSHVEGQKAKSIASSYGAAVAILGAALGQWSSLLIEFFFKK